MSAKIQNLIVLLGIILIAFLGYYLYTQNANSQLMNGTIDNQVALETSLFLERLIILQGISLDDSLFSNSRFQSLVDFSEPIIPQPIGRDNPFSSN
ncbi:MAG: hypothetical protein AUK16_01390 [Parcubacteria group bacterium CG2_30_44_11]|nr:MAG: hypothetical protein AUK16_01390 [Parcubacteria group bacterium CG2_30_44_11]